MAYDAETLRQEGVFNASADEAQSGIWAGDAGPAADEDGNVFVATGNGKFDAASKGGRDFGDSVLKLSLGADGLAVRDYFTPFDEARLNQADLDLGSGWPGPVGRSAGTAPARADRWRKRSCAVCGRSRPDGKFSCGQRQPDRAGNSRGGRHLRRSGVLQPARVYPGQQRRAEGLRRPRRRLSAQPVAQASRKFIDPGATPTISSSGTKDGIVWVIETKGWQSPDTSAVLHAYDAANVAHELSTATRDMDRDRAGLCLRFTIPTVANGRVYVGAKSEVDVYGLLPAARRRNRRSRSDTKEELSIISQEKILRSFLAVALAALALPTSSETYGWVPQEASAQAAPLRIGIAGLVHGHVFGFFQTYLHSPAIQIVGYRRAGSETWRRVSQRSMGSTKASFTRA